MSAEIIAELEINHGKSISIAKQLIYAAKKVGANTVKFQAFKAEEFTSPTSEYRKIFESVELNDDQFNELKKYCESLNIGFLLTIADITSTKLIKKLNLKRVKIGSTNITNQILLKKIAETKCDVILSTGASNIKEVEEAVEILKANGTKQIALLHCTVSYPCSAENVCINGMLELKKVFPNLEVGYSDHTIGERAAILAIAHEATIIEKHFTLSEYMDGPDHNFCSNPAKFKEFIEAIREAETMMGRREKQSKSIETGARITGRRYLTYKYNFCAGHKLKQEDLLIQRLNAKDAKEEGVMAPTLSNEEYLCSNELRQDVEMYQPCNFSHYKKQ